MGKTFSHHLVMQYFEVSHFSNFYCDLYKTSRFDRNNVEIGSLLKRQVRGAKISLEKSVCVTLYPQESMAFEGLKAIAASVNMLKYTKVPLSTQFYNTCYARNNLYEQGPGFLSW